MREGREGENKVFINRKQKRKDGFVIQIRISRIILCKYVCAHAQYKYIYLNDRKQHVAYLFMIFQLKNRSKRYGYTIYRH